MKFPEKAKTVTDSLGIAAAPMTTSPSNFDPGMTPRGRNGRFIVVMLHFFVLKSTMYILFYEKMTEIYLGLFHTIRKKASRNNTNQIILICYTGMWFGLCVAFFFKLPMHDLLIPYQHRIQRVKQYQIKILSKEIRS